MIKQIHTPTTFHLRKATEHQHWAAYYTSLARADLEPVVASLMQQHSAFHAQLARAFLGLEAFRFGDRQ